MEYADNSSKFVCVINTKMGIPLPRLMNALGHVTAGLVARLPVSAAEFLEYPNDVDGFVACIARQPIIILKAKNGNQLSELRKAAARAGIPNNVFVSTMFGASAEEQIAKTAQAASEDLHYLAVMLYGQAEEVDPLTRKFSLFPDLLRNLEG